MKKLIEATSSGSVAGGGYNKPINTIIKRTINPSPDKSGSCPCKNLPGKVTCGLCSPKRK